MYRSILAGIGLQPRRALREISAILVRRNPKWREVAVSDIDWTATGDEYHDHLYRFDQPGIFGELEYWLGMFGAALFGGWPLVILVHALMK